MMLGVVASNGEMMPPVWFKAGYGLTMGDYRDILGTNILPWVKNITNGAYYAFQQDGAPAHTAKVVQEWLGLNVQFWLKDFWPLQSHDLNPLDYIVWAQIEGKACTTRHSSVDAKPSVNRAWTSVGKGLQGVCIFQASPGARDRR